MSFASDGKGAASGKALRTLQQQMKGVTDAAFGRRLRVTAGMWKRGGSTKPGAKPVTHYEAAYRAYLRGQDKAFANRALNSREEESVWCKFGYYSTLATLDKVGGEINTRFVDPARTKPALPDNGLSLAEPATEPVTEAEDEFVGFGMPGHSIPYEDDHTGAKYTITVTDDGNRLILESVRRKNGEPAHTEGCLLREKKSVWARYYWFAMVEEERAGMKQSDEEAAS